MYRVYKIDENTYERQEEILGIISIQWEDNLKDSKVSFSFETIEKLQPKQWVEVYSSIEKTSILRGFIYQTSRTNINIIKYTCYDFGYFLEKSAPQEENIITMQYKSDTNITQAIEELCKRSETDCKIKIKKGEIVNMPGNIKEIFEKDIVNNILNKLLGIANKQQEKYYIDCTNGYLNIREYSRNNNLKGYIANTYAIDSLNTIQKNFEIVYDVDDTIKNKISFTALGNSNMRKGTIINMDNDILNAYGDYLVEKSTHAITSAKESVNVNLRKLALL